MSGLDDWLPRYDHREYHERAVTAPPEQALAAALSVPAESDWIVRLLFRLRGVDGRGKSLEQFVAPPFATVLERTPTDFAAQVTGQGVPGTGLIVSAGRVPTIVLDVRARPAGGGSVLSTETRVAGGGLRFRAYWLVVRPFSGLIRRRWLIAAAKRVAAPSPNAR